MNRYIIFFLSIFIFLAAGLRAQETPNREVKAGVFHFDGFHNLNKEGGMEGYGIDLLNLISDYSRLNFNFIGYDKSWQDMQDMLRNGEIDIVASARKTPERERDFTFSLPVGRNHTLLSKKLTNKKIKAGDYDSYNNIRIGVINGSSQNQYLEPFAKDKGFTYKLIEFELPEEMAKALQNGEVDAILSSNLRRPDNEITLDIIKSDNFYIIARHEDQDIIDEINYAIEQMYLNEGDWQNDLYFNHYGGANLGSHDFTNRERNFIDESLKNGKSVKAISRADLSPYSYVENGQLKGVLPDFFKQIMQHSGLPYEFVIAESYEDYINKSKSEEVDVILDSIEPESSHGGGVTLLHTEPYIQAGVAKLKRHDFQGRERVVALAENAPFVLHPMFLENLEVKYYPNSQKAMEAVESGEVDTAYVLPMTAQIFVNSKTGNNLYYTMLEKSGADFRMQIPASNNHELISILKKSIKYAPQGLYNQLGASYISRSAIEMSLSQYLEAHPTLLIFSSLALMLTAMTIIFMGLRSYWSRRLLTETERINYKLEGQLAIVEALSRDYANVLAINPDDATASIIKISDKKVVDDAGEGNSEMEYQRIINNYADKKVYPDDQASFLKDLRLSNVLEKLNNHDQFSGTYRALVDGKTMYFQYNFVRPGKHAHSADNIILAGFRNIDQVMRHEQEQKAALEKALEASRYASAAKTSFLNNMSHDIRTPMNAIIGFTTLALANAEKTSLVRRYLEKIITSGNHLLKLINDVLNMSRIESGKVKIKEEKLSLAQIVRDLQTISQSDVRTKNLGLVVEAVNVNNESILSDKLRLNQVLLNVLSNAIKYTPNKGRVIFSLKQTSRASEGHANYEFHIRDTGIGMSKDFLKRVFDPFEREQTSTVSGIEGTGLGLSITKKIIDMMGGAIEVKSEINEGSEFILSFRFKVDNENELESLAAGLEGKRVLLINENGLVCTSLSDMLARLGLESQCVTWGKEAEKLAAEALDSGRPYDFILMSWHILDMDGQELVNSLRKIISENVPIIILEPSDEPGMKEEAKPGVNGVYPRPLFISELAAILDEQKKLAGNNADREKKSFAGKSILLVEDNEMNQEIAVTILEDAGFKVEVAENGQEAVDKIDSMPPDSYDLILMDVQMPVMNGYEATRRIRGMADPVKSSIAIIAMTANAFDEDRMEAEKSGMNGYVAKPIDIKNLMDTLEEMLANPKESGRSD